MNYFEFYDIVEAFNIDEAVVKRKFYELSKAYHPDFFANESEDKQSEILELSTLNNKAYQVLYFPQKRMEYILQLHGLLQEGEKYPLAQDFLIEMMDINEALMELEFEPDPTALTKIKSEVNQIEIGFKNELQTLADKFDHSTSELKKSILLKIKDLWYRQKYLLRITDSLNKFATR